MDTSLDTARFNMVQQQIRPWDVNDHRVLETLAAIPRERFVPAAYRGLAYADIEIPLGEGQTMLAPKIIARLLQALSIAADERILEIGTGSGYLTACLSHLGDGQLRRRRASHCRSACGRCSRFSHHGWPTGSPDRRGSGRVRSAGDQGSSRGRLRDCACQAALDARTRRCCVGQGIARISHG